MLLWTNVMGRLELAMVRERSMSAISWSFLVHEVIS